MVPGLPLNLGSFPFIVLGKLSKVPEAEVKHPTGLLPTRPGPILPKSWRKVGCGQSVYRVDLEIL